MAELTRFELESTSLLDQITNANSFSEMQPFTFADANEELRVFIEEIGAKEDHTILDDHPEATKRLRELASECGYLDKECRLQSIMHFVGPTDDYLPPEELSIAQGLVVATPQSFLFMKSPLNGRVEPFLVSHSSVYSQDSDEPELVEVFTPFSTLQIQLHTPGLN